MEVRKIIVVILALCSILWAFSGGDGSQSNPYQISTRADLEAVNNNLSACYILMNDIDLSGITYTESVIASYMPEYSFRGSFDGNGFKIAGLKISNSTHYYIGLFSTLSGAIIKNLGIENCNISGIHISGGYVGGLCGESNISTIESCYCTGFIEGGCIAGGLCGLSSYDTISNCYFIGNVFAPSNHHEVSFAGGISGISYFGTFIERCYSTGNIYASTEGYADSHGVAGGICGWNCNSINNSYSTCNVGTDSKVYCGGLCGENIGTISNCYSTGNISATMTYIESLTGGLCGISRGDISNSYWDIQTSGQTTSAGGTGKTTSQMKDINTFLAAGWDFESVWYMPENDYPKLIGMNREGRLKTVIKDLEGITTSGLICKLYSLAGDYLGIETDRTTDANGEAEWDNLAYGLYSIKVYKAAELPFNDYCLWAIKQIDFDENVDSIEIQRDMPSAGSVIFSNARGQGGLVDEYTKLFAQSQIDCSIPILNSTTSVQTVKVNLVLDRNQYSPYDISLPDTSSSLNQQNIEFMNFFNFEKVILTESSNNQNYYYAVSVETLVDGQYEQTDTLTWKPTVIVLARDLNYYVDSDGHGTDDLLEFPSNSGITWYKVNAPNSNNSDGYYWENVDSSNNNLIFNVKTDSGIGSQVDTVSKNYHYGTYKAKFKCPPPTTEPEGLCSGFFYYWSNGQEEATKIYQEIDVEILSKNPNEIHFTLHDRHQNEQGTYIYTQQSFTHTTEVDLSSEFHEYGFEWQEDNVIFFFGTERFNPKEKTMEIKVRTGTSQKTAEDAEPQSKFTIIPDQPGQIILNNWTGNPEWTGPCPVSGDFPFIVESVSYLSASQSEPIPEPEIAGGGSATIVTISQGISEENYSIGSMGTGAKAIDCTYIIENLEVDPTKGFSTLKLYYAPSEVQSIGLVEENLRIYWYNEETGNWFMAGNESNNQNNPQATRHIGQPTNNMGDWGVDTEGNYVWANIDHASIYAVAGFPSEVYPGDLAGESITDEADLFVLASMWLECSQYLLDADLNKDGCVDIVDFNIIAKHWFEIQ